MSEITTFLNAKIKTEVKKNANLDWMLPHFINSKETNEFVCYVFYCSTYIKKKEDDGKETLRYKEQKMIVWSERMAKTIDEQIKQGATHFSGIAVLKSFDRKTNKDDDGKSHAFYEKMEYWVSNGNAHTFITNKQQGNNKSKFANYTNGTANASNIDTGGQTTPPDEIDDDIPF